jgi:thioesterase domain-containing protein
VPSADRCREQRITQNIFVSMAVSGDSHIVPLRISGNGSPVFCFPGAGGNAHLFREMATVLPEGQPIYAIDLEWLCDLTQHFTIEQLAAFYLDGVRKIQRNGPYYFCGYSFGGLVAYEIAVRLTDEGDSANLVALLDVPNPALISDLSWVDSAQFRKAYLSDRVRKYGRQLIYGDIKAFVTRGLGFVTSRTRRVFMPSIKMGCRMLNRRLPGRLRGYDPGFLNAWRGYTPKRYAKRLVCFRVQDRGPEHDRDLSMGWDAYALGGVDVHVVPGRHTDMLKMPYVHALADKLTAYLDYGSELVDPSTRRLSPWSLDANLKSKRLKNGSSEQR